MLETFSKSKELRKYIGDTFSDNFSSTLRSRLLGVENKNGKECCLIAEAPSPYSTIKPKKEYRIVGIEYVYTCFFGV
jgi:hypothetical protein